MRCKHTAHNTQVNKLVGKCSKSEMSIAKTTAVLAIIASTCVAAASRSKRLVDDPLLNLSPMALPTTLGAALTPSTRPPTPTSEQPTRREGAGGTRKRAVNHVVVSRALDEAESADDTAPNSDERCTLVLPRSCACSQSDLPSIQLIHQQVKAAKTEIDETRDRLLSDQQRYPTPYAMHVLVQDVELLKQEGRNTNGRITQLYTQLMHEMVNKRDNQLDFATLSNKFLNQTVKMYQLQEKLDAMRAENELLKRDVAEQSRDMSDMQKSLAVLKKKVDTLLAAAGAKQPSTGQATRVPATAQTRYHSTERMQQLQPSSLPVYHKGIASGSYRDCTEAQNNGHSTSGTYRLRIRGVSKTVKVWCDFDEDPGGWTVIQRRANGRVNFQRGMARYMKGFGRLHADHWLGLETIHRMTNRTDLNYKLHVALEDWGGNKRFVEYRSFRVEGKKEGYRLHIAHYSGNGGDGMTRNNNMRFTTRDVDNDEFTARNCAELQRGAWWFAACGDSNLNGVYYGGGFYRSMYQDGIYWAGWRGNSYSLRRVEMKIRPSM